MASTKLYLSRMLPNLERKELIGSGSFGNVYRAELDGKPVAVKILHEHYFREPHSNNECLKKFEAECKILQELQHENVVTLLDFIISHKSPPMLITELLDCDLGKHIRNCHPGKIPFSETVSIMLDVAEGLAYLHQQNPPIVHRDVASKNILFTIQYKFLQYKIIVLLCPERQFMLHQKRFTPTMIQGFPCQGKADRLSNMTLRLTSFHSESL